MHGNLAAMEADLALGPAPAVAEAAFATAMRRAGELLRSSQSICSIAPMPAVRQKRSNELATSCQAISSLGKSAIAEGLVTFVMALLSFADSTPEPNGSGGQRLLP
jgi:hypothetical protein